MKKRKKVIKLKFYSNKYMQTKTEEFEVCNLEYIRCDECTKKIEEGDLYCESKYQEKAGCMFGGRYEYKQLCKECMLKFIEKNVKSGVGVFNIDIKEFKKDEVKTSDLLLGLNHDQYASRDEVKGDK